MPLTEQRRSSDTSAIGSVDALELLFKHQVPSRLLVGALEPGPTRGLAVGNDVMIMYKDALESVPPSLHLMALNCQAFSLSANGGELEGERSSYLNVKL